MTWEQVSKVVSTLAWPRRSETTLGFTPYNIIYSCPKKSGKTEIGGLAATWFALSDGPYNEVYCPANDEDQSKGRVFREASRAIQSNPRLGSVKVGQSILTFPNGTEIHAIASDWPA